MTQVPSQPGPSSFDVAEQIVDFILRPSTPIQRVSVQEFVTALEANNSLAIIRQALALLQRDGILRPAPNDTYSVRYLTRTEAKEILALRAETQKLIVGRLAAGADGERLNHAKEILELLGQSLDDGAAFLRLERQFWSELARVGGFLTATQTIASWSDQLRVFRTVVPLKRQEAQVIFETLTTMLEKVEQQDAPAGIDVLNAQVQAMLAHL